MLGLVLRRAAGGLGVLLLLVVVVFVLQHTRHADPIRARLGAGATDEAVAAERERRGWDDPLPVQFVRYLGDVVTGDLGESVRTSRPVREDLRTVLPASLELIGATLSVAIVVGVALGLVTARPGAPAGLVRVTMLGLSSIPGFLLTLVGILVLYRRLDWLPASGRTGITDAPTGPTGLLTVDGLLQGRLGVTADALHHLVLPAGAAAVMPAASIARLLRSSLVATLASEQVRTARAKGMTETQVVLRHGLRNSVGPALSFVGLITASLFAGTLVVEQIVAWPGIGAYLLRGIAGSDFPAIAGVTLVLGCLYVTLNTVVEILQHLVDPRIARP